jgi:hypothetical protein
MYPSTWVEAYMEGKLRGRLEPAALTEAEGTLVLTRERYMPPATVGYAATYPLADKATDEDGHVDLSRVAAALTGNPQEERLFMHRHVMQEMVERNEFALRKLPTVGDPDQYELIVVRHDVEFPKSLALPYRCRGSPRAKRGQESCVGTTITVSYEDVCQVVDAIEQYLWRKGPGWRGPPRTRH